MINNVDHPAATFLRCVFAWSGPNFGQLRRPSPPLRASRRDECRSAEEAEDLPEQLFDERPKDCNDAGYGGCFFGSGTSFIA
jgi:hypothetical protein